MLLSRRNSFFANLKYFVKVFFLDAGGLLSLDTREIVSCLQNVSVKRFRKGVFPVWRMQAHMQVFVLTTIKIIYFSITKQVFE